MLFAHPKNLTNISTIYLSINPSIYLSTACRLEDECPGSKKLKIRLQSEVNLITFNSSQFPGSSLHCHLGHRHIDPDTTQHNPLEGNKTVAITVCAYSMVDSSGIYGVSGISMDIPVISIFQDPATHFTKSGDIL